MYRFKTIDSQWFTDLANPAPIGIVLAEVQDEDGQKIGTTAFVGVGSGSLSIYSERDCQRLANFGARFPKAAAEALFHRKIEDWVYL